MEEIIRFVMLAQTDRFTITDLCEQFGISRKTAYKHLERYAAGGVQALGPRSHRPHSFPQRTAEEIEKLVLAERRLHRTWGPKKLQDILLKKHGVAESPACSTIGEMLRRHGLSVRRRRRPGAYEDLNDDLTIPSQPNRVWTVDFKGWFTLGNGQRCDPLTVCDRFSHFVLAVRAQPEATEPPSANLAAQQRRFERWRHTYNHERPHESLDQQRPAEVYQPAERRLSENDKPTAYPSGFEVKEVSDSGHVAHEGKNYHLGEAFAGKRIGLRRTVPAAESRTSDGGAGMSTTA